MTPALGLQPIMIFQPAKIAAFSRLCFERKIAVVVVCFPATSLLTARARVCISAAHTHEQLQAAARVPPPSLAQVVNHGLLHGGLHSLAEEPSAA